MRLVNKNTEFFTTELPEDILDELTGYFEEKGFKFQVAKDRYKVKVEILIEEQEPIDMCIRIL